MKISNSEILNKVKNKISDKKEKSLDIKKPSINETENNIENEIKKSSKFMNLIASLI